MARIVHSAYKKDYIITQSHSTISHHLNLILQEERVTSLLEERHTVDLVYLDFAKEFDSVNFRFPLAKLNASGINGAVLNWI